MSLCVHSGKIAVVNRDGTYAVAFDDGDYLPDASADEIRFVPVEEIARQNQLESLAEFVETHAAASDPSGNSGAVDILSSVESFLLPEPLSGIEVESSHPHNQLDKLLNALAIGDHVRLLQTMYRDEDDELLLGKEYRQACPLLGIMMQKILGHAHRSRNRINNTRTNSSW